MSACLLLSSCGLYNKYERPDVDTKGLVRDVTSDKDTLAVADTTSFGNLPWRSVFTDPQSSSGSLLRITSIFSTQPSMSI